MPKPQGEPRFLEVKRKFGKKRDERLVKQTERQPKRACPCQRRAQTSSARRGRAVTRGNWHVPVFPPISVPETTCDVCQPSANTSLSVPILDKKKVRGGDWFVFLIHGKDSKSQKRRKKEKKPKTRSGSFGEVNVSRRKEIADAPLH